MLSGDTLRSNANNMTSRSALFKCVGEKHAFLQSIGPKAINRQLSVCQHAVRGHCLFKENNPHHHIMKLYVQFYTVSRRS